MDSGESHVRDGRGSRTTTQAVAVRGMLPASVDPWHRDRLPVLPISSVHEAARRRSGVTAGRAHRERSPLRPDPPRRVLPGENRPIDYDGDSIVAAGRSEDGCDPGPGSATATRRTPLGRLEVRLPPARRRGADLAHRRAGGRRRTRLALRRRQHLRRPPRRRRRGGRRNPGHRDGLVGVHRRPVRSRSSWADSPSSAPRPCPSTATNDGSRTGISVQRPRLGRGDDAGARGRAARGPAAFPIGSLRPGRRPQSRESGRPRRRRFRRGAPRRRDDPYLR